MQKKLPYEWVRAIKKHINHLSAADNYQTFKNLGLGKPEILENSAEILCSLHISPNVRLIIELKATKEEIMSCEEIVVKGVCDYHGEKENWYIP